MEMRPLERLLALQLTNYTCEVTGGFEPPYRVLQTHALPLGHMTIQCKYIK